MTTIPIEVTPPPRDEAEALQYDRWLIQVDGVTRGPFGPSDDVLELCRQACASGSDVELYGLLRSFTPMRGDT